MQRLKLRSKIDSWPLGLEADQEQLADLVGGQRQREFLFGEPGGKLARAGDFEGRRSVLAGAVGLFR
jgi:hypothetical protein